jgi:hypothetical protein
VPPLPPLKEWGVAVRASLPRHKRWAVTGRWSFSVGMRLPDSSLRVWSLDYWSDADWWIAVDFRCDVARRSLVLI